MKEALNQSDLLLVLLDHNEFKVLKQSSLDYMNHKKIFDTKNVVNVVPKEVDYMY